MPIIGDRVFMLPEPKVDKEVAEAGDAWLEKVFEKRTEQLKKLVEAADYLQHCRRREVQAMAIGCSGSAKKSVERASDQYDYLRGLVKL